MLPDRGHVSRFSLLQPKGLVNGRCDFVTSSMSGRSDGHQLSLRRVGACSYGRALHMSHVLAHPWIRKNWRLPTQSWEKEVGKPALFGFHAHSKITLMGWVVGKSWNCMCVLGETKALRKKTSLNFVSAECRHLAFILSWTGKHVKNFICI